MTYAQHAHAQCIGHRLWRELPGPAWRRRVTGQMGTRRVRACHTPVTCRAARARATPGSRRARPPAAFLVLEYPTLRSGGNARSAAIAAPLCPPNILIGRQHAIFTTGTQLSM